MKRDDLLIKNACVVTGAGPVFESGWVHVAGGRIDALGSMSDLRAPRRASRVVDAGGRFLLPGFINPHTHLYGRLAQGMPVGRMKTLRGVLENLWWKLDRALTRDDVYISAMIGGIEAIRAGVTTICDHHASYGAISGSLRAVSKALSELGLRASLCFEISDRDGKRARDEALAESGHFLDESRGRASKGDGFLQRGMVGLHASMTLSDGTLEAARELMDIYGVGAHVHVAEGIEDVLVTKRMNGTTPAARLRKFGILRPGTIAAHCVHVSDADIRTLRKSGATAVHNPLSNFNNAVGVAPVPRLVQARVPVAVGTDGMSSGVACDIRAASVIHKCGERDAQAGGDSFSRFVWEAAPEIVSGQFGFEVGKIARGAAADLVISEAKPATAVTEENAWWHLLFGVLTAPVRTTVVAGRIKMQDFKLQGIDEASAYAEARELSDALWKRMKRRRS